MKHNKYITSVGYNKLQEKLVKLRQDYKELMLEMQEVKDNCLSSDDTSELNQYRMTIDSLSDGIEKTRELLETSIVVDTSKLTTTKAIFGTLVTVENLDTGEESVYRLVSSFESDPKEGQLSIQSPLGMSILGCSVGDIVELNSPRGLEEYEIVTIDR